MDPTAAALLRRVRLTLVDPAAELGVLHLDGWPLLLVDAAAGTVRVNDLRASALFAHAVTLPAPSRAMAIRVGAVGDELYVLLGTAAVFATPESGRATHVDVQVVAATGRLLFDRAVRYRQLPVAMPSAVSANGRG